MAAMSNYLENKLIDHLFRGQTFSAPTNLYVGLFSTAPTDADGGVELSGNDYSRSQLSTSLSAFSGTQSSSATTESSGTSGTTYNIASITFPQPSANWGTVTAFGVFDSLNGGNLLFYGNLSIAKTINQGDTVTFPSASLSFQIDN